MYENQSQQNDGVNVHQLNTSLEPTNETFRFDTNSQQYEHSLEPEEDVDNAQQFRKSPEPTNQMLWS